MDIIDREAPMKNVHARTRYFKWLSKDTKQIMQDRDNAREIARRTDSQQDWITFRTKRNLCTKLQRTYKANHLRKTYDRIEVEKDTSKLYGMTMELLGWRSAGPPTSLSYKGRTSRKQQDIAEMQAQTMRTRLWTLKTPSQ